MERAEAATKEGLRLSEEAGIGGSLAASLWSVLGEAAATRGDHERAKELLEESLALYQKVGDRRFVTRVLVLLGNLSMEQKDYEQAKELYEESVASARELGEETGIGVGLVCLGYVFLLEGEHDRAMELFEEAEALLRERGHKGFLTGAIDNLGWAALLQGDHERAKSHYEESLVLCKELGDKLIASESLEGLVCIFGAAEALRETVGYHHTLEENALRKPYLATARSRLGEVEWQTAHAQGRAMGLEQAIEYALSDMKPAMPLSPELEQPSSDKLPSLTRREKEVAVLVARGLTNRRIASELVLSEHTVHHHVTNILRELNLTSRQQVASHLPDR